MEKKVNRRKRATRAANGAGTLVKHGRFYHARWHVAGKLISKSLKTDDLETAKAELERLSVPRAGMDERTALRKIAQVMSHSLTDISDRMKLTSLPVAQLFALFRDAPNRPEITPGTMRAYQGQFSVFATWLASRHPDITNARDISQAIADEYAAHRAKTKSPNTHNKDLNLFAQTWRLLASRFGLDYNPWTEDHIARLKLRPNSRRNLTREECRAILDAATLEEKTIIGISLFAALRLGDAVRLTWADVDLDRNWLTKTQRKTGRRVCVPIAAPLKKLLHAWKAEQGDDAKGYLFPRQIKKLKPDGNTENISRNFRRLFERAGIETHAKSDSGVKFRAASFHSLRHTFITNLMSAGIDPLLVKEAAGHSIMATTAGYTHIGEATLRRAIEKAALG